MSVIQGYSRIATFLCMEHSSFLKKWSSVLLAKKNYSVQQTFKRDKPLCYIGTIGDHGHGKTSLTSAITKVLSEKSLTEFVRVDQLDRSPEERAKKLTINPELKSYQTVSRYYTHVDLPGSQKYFKNMIRDCSALDFAIFVVSASEGISEHGKENLLVAKHFGVKNLVVFLNKTDNTPSELVQVAEIEVRDVLEEVGFDVESTPILSGSALAALEGNEDDVTGKHSILNLLKAVDSIPNPIRTESNICLLNIINVFSVPGIGTVIRGKLERGTIRKGDKMTVFGYGYRKEDTVTGLEIFRKPVEEALAGDCISVQLKKLRKDDIKKGMVACSPGAYDECDFFEGEFTYFSSKESLQDFITEDGTRRKIFSKSWELEGILLPTDGEASADRSKSRVKILLPKPMFVEVGQSFLLQRNNLEALGYVTKTLPSLTQEQKMEYFLSKRKKK